MGRITFISYSYQIHWEVKTQKEALPSAELVYSDLFSLLTPGDHSAALQMGKKKKKKKTMIKSNLQI
jgi:hypothetical protein